MRALIPTVACTFWSSRTPTPKPLLLWLQLAFLFSAILPVVTYAQGQPTPGQNVNMVSGTTWPRGDPFLERKDGW